MINLTPSSANYSRNDDDDDNGDDDDSDNQMNRKLLEDFQRIDNDFRMCMFFVKIDCAIKYDSKINEKMCIVAMGP